jgi:hypothetical protein
MPTWIRRYLFTHYTPEILLNPVFEDLRRPKVPNRNLRSEVITLRNEALEKIRFCSP